MERFVASPSIQYCQLKIEIKLISAVEIKNYKRSIFSDSANKRGKYIFLITHTDTHTWARTQVHIHARTHTHVYIYHHHHHHVVLVALISLTLSRHFSLSIIASGKSSGLHLVSSHSCWMYVRAGRLCVGVHKSTSLMSSSLLLQQCPACLVRLTWIVFVAV